MSISNLCSGGWGHYACTSESCECECHKDAKAENTQLRAEVAKWKQLAIDIWRAEMCIDGPSFDEVRDRLKAEGIDLEKL